jgi:cytochrome c nitrite reductase small subunit
MRALAAGVVSLGALLGVGAGLGGYTFVYARGGSYLTDDSAACANCHVMREHYEGWLRSSHHAVASCNGCHTPHGLIPKYATKASNGFWHSFAFTTGRFPDPLRIKPRNRAIAEAACRGCHGEIVDAMDGAHAAAGGVECVRCHGAVGHPGT